MTTMTTKTAACVYKYVHFSEKEILVACIIEMDDLYKSQFSRLLMQWSFGVTCWEVFSGGMIPYGGISPMALLHLLQNGERLSKPPNSACTNRM